MPGFHWTALHSGRFDCFNAGKAEITSLPENDLLVLFLLFFYRRAPEFSLLLRDLHTAVLLNLSHVYTILFFNIITSTSHFFL
jgi:hypothetical protein